MTEAITEAPAVAEISKEEAKLCAINEARKDVTVMVIELSAAVAAKKQAQHAYDASLARLLSVIDDEAEGLPLFDMQKNGEAWRDVSVSDLDITPAMTTKLIDRQLGTLGLLADYTAVEGNRLIDITGIGSAAEEKINDAVTRYYSEHPEYCQSNGDNGTESPNDND